MQTLEFFSCRQEDLLGDVTFSHTLTEAMHQLSKSHLKFEEVYSPLSYLSYVLC